MRCRCIESYRLGSDFSSTEYRFIIGGVYEYKIDSGYVTVDDIINARWFFSMEGFSKRFVDIVEERDRKISEILGQDG